MAKTGRIANPETWQHSFNRLRLLHTDIGHDTSWILAILSALWVTPGKSINDSCGPLGRMTRINMACDDQKKRTYPRGVLNSKDGGIHMSLQVDECHECCYPRNYCLEFFVGENIYLNISKAFLKHSNANLKQTPPLESTLRIVYNHASWSVQNHLLKAQKKPGSLTSHAMNHSILDSALEQ